MRRRWRDNAEVHNTGEVWAHDAVGVLRRAAQCRTHFQTAQNRMRGYLVAAYKATTRDSTFVEARDALLAAIAAATARLPALRSAFAKRGLGPGALAPDPFDPDERALPNRLQGELLLGPGPLHPGRELRRLAGELRLDGVLDRGEKGVLSLVLQNGGHLDLSQGTVTVSTVSPGVTIADGGVFPIGSIVAGKSKTVQIPVSLALDAGAGPGEVDLKVAVDDPEVDAGVAATRVLSGTEGIRVDTDDLTNSVSTDDVEGTTSAWTASPRGRATTRESGPSSRPPTTRGTPRMPTASRTSRWSARRCRWVRQR